MQICTNFFTHPHVRQLFRLWGLNSFKNLVTNNLIIIASFFINSFAENIQDRTYVNVSTNDVSMEEKCSDFTQLFTLVYDSTIKEQIHIFGNNHKNVQLLIKMISVSYNYISLIIRRDSDVMAKLKILNLWRWKTLNGCIWT